jgi:hypothetical protein
MRFVVLRVLKHNELGMFHGYRRKGKERAKQRAINFDSDVVDRVFPAAADSDKVMMSLRYQTDDGVREKKHWIKHQEKNWRLEGNCPTDHCYDFVDPGCLFAMVVDAGKRPATGAWAVYPAEHRVTVAILMNAESSALTSHAMIALQGDEGKRTLSLLRDSRPDLFGTEEETLRVDIRKSKTGRQGVKGLHLPPDPRRLVRILASVGHTLPSAVADIVDNSISAGATEIRITFGRPDKGHGRWMAIADNGRGMISEKLAEAMRIGSDTDYDAKDLGKYGYGLKGASWSQTDSFSVVSKQAGKKSSSLAWDTEAMDGWEVQKGVIEPWMARAADLGGHGTAVIWRNMRMPQSAPVAKGTDPYTSEIMDLERHLGLVFHRFLDGQVQGRAPVTIRINETRKIPSNNPVGHPLATLETNKLIRIPIDRAEARVGVRVYVLPSVSEVRAMHGNDAEAARRDLDKIGMYGRANESQGLYMYRNDRLIQWGGWHEMWATMDEKTKLARVIVDFGRELDDRFAVNISKQIVVLPQFIQTEIKKLAEPARNESRRKYRKDASPKQSDNKARASTRAASSTKAGPETSGTSQTGAERGAIPRIVARTVKSEMFAWKIGKSMSGAKDVQVSDKEHALATLLASVNFDPVALASLVGFLERLDKVDTQKALLLARE